MRRVPGVAEGFESGNLVKQPAQSHDVRFHIDFGIVLEGRAHAGAQVPVGDVNFAKIAEDNMLGTQGSMGDSMMVGESEGITGLVKNAEQTLECKMQQGLGPPVFQLAQDRAQSSSADSAHRVKRIAGLIEADVVDRRDIRML